MRGARQRVVIGGVVLAAVGAGAFTYLSASDGGPDPIRVGTTDKVTALDPAGAYDGGSWALFSNLYQSLLTFRTGGTTPVPDAASRCDFSDAALRTYTCRLRPGLRFSSGREMTSADVKFSFDRIRSIDDAQGPSPLLDSLKAVRTAGARTVVFDLSYADATFPFKIATGAGSIVDRAAYSDAKLLNTTKVSGSGPYVLKDYEPGKRAELRPNPHYEGAAGGKPQPVSVHYYADSGALDKAWQAHDLDVTGRSLPPSVVADLNPVDPETKVVESASATTRNLVFNTRAKSAAHDVAVRRAMAAVVDRGAIARDAYDRTVDPLYSLIPQGFSGHTTSFYDSYPKPDPARAAALLHAAGISTPVHLTIGYANAATAKLEAESLVKQLEATHLFTVDLKNRDWARFQDEFSHGAYDAFLVSWIADFPDPDNFTAPLIGPGAAWHNGYRSDRVDELIRATQRETQRTRTLADFHEIQRIAAEDVPLLPLWQQKVQVLSTNSITGTQYLSDGTGNWRLSQLGRF